MADKKKQKGEKKEILILGTGGTLGMKPGNEGQLAPDQVLNDLLTHISELREYALIELDVICNLDSSLIDPSLWLDLARRIDAVQTEGRFDGVVVLHGTDTLAYTASALSFMLPNLSIPVVFTGSQRPLAMTRSDARNNVLGAVETVLEGPVEVMVFFHHRALRGNRVTKDTISDFKGFVSPNYPVLGTVGIYWEWNKDLFWPETKRPTLWKGIPDSLPEPPWVIPWVPGLRFEKLAPALDGQWAVILEAFGTGNMPFDRETERALGGFQDKGGIVLIKSQVPHGISKPESYEPGRAMLRMGFVNGKDMTREAMVTKLMVLKGLGVADDKMARYMTTSLAGELSE